MYYLSLDRSLRGIGLGSILIFVVLKMFISSGLSMSMKNMNNDSHATIKDADYILQQNPSNYDAYTRRAFAHYSLFEGELALNDYNHALAIMPSAKLYKMRADTYDLMGDSTRATQDRQTAASFAKNP